MPQLVMFVLDAELGKPVQGMQIQLLHMLDSATFETTTSGVTGADGCLRTRVSAAKLPGQFRAVYQPHEFHSRRPEQPTFPEICVDFGWQGSEDLVLPLLFTVHGYTVYRGS